MTEIAYTKTERTKKICEYLQNNDKFKKLHDCSERFVYPFVPKDIETKARANYMIGDDETVLFVQTYSPDLQSSTVITDVAIRVAFENPMNFVFFTWDNKTRWVYNGENLVYFDDLHKITTPLHISFIYRSPNAVRHEDNFGENVAEIFNQINEWSSENTSDTYNKLVERYIRKHKEDDMRRYKSPYEKKLLDAKGALKDTTIIGAAISLFVIISSFRLFAESIVGGMVLIGIVVGIFFVFRLSKSSDVEAIEKQLKADLKKRQNETLEAYRLRVLNQYEKQKNRAMTQQIRTYIDDVNDIARAINEGYEMGNNIGSAINIISSILG